MEDPEMELPDMDGGVTASFLHMITGEEDLACVSTLELCIDAADACLFDLGQLVPNLRELKLLNSVLPQIRDLGTGLTQLEVLWVPRCGLQEVDGLGSLPQLRELYAAFNDIDDLAPIAGLDHLEVLDLEANKVADLDSVAFLGMCSKLGALTLEGNEVAAMSAYRSSVFEMIPTLTMLDERPVGPEAAEARDDDVAACPSSDPSVSGECNGPDAQRELVLVRDGIKYARPAAQATEDGLRIPGERATSAPSQSTTSRPASAAAHLRHSYSAGFPRPWSPGVGVRPMSAIGSRPSSATGTRPGTGRQRPGTAHARQRLPEAQVVTDHASTLTFGSDDVFCGNPVQALRRRKAAAASSSSPSLSNDDTTQVARAGRAHGNAQSGESEYQQLLQELAEVKAQSVEDETATEFSTQDGEGKPQADIFVVERSVSSPQSTGGVDRTRVRSKKIGDESRPRQPISRRTSGLEAEPPSNHEPLKPTMHRTPQVVGKTPGGGVKSEGSRGMVARSKENLPRSPEPTSVGRIRPRNRPSAQTCVVGS